MSFDELKNLLIEYVGLLPRNCVARIRYYRPFVIFHMSGPDAHHGRRGKQVSIGGDDKSRRRYASDFRKCVRRSKRLIGGSRLARIFVNLAPTFGALRADGSIRRADLPVDSSLFSEFGDFDSRDDIGDGLVR